MSTYKNFEDFVRKNNNLFDKHVAKITKIDTGENDCIVEFKRPDTSDGAMVILYIKGYLTFQGDYGNGSFTWYNPRNTLGWMADTGFGYFMSKIQSCEDGISGVIMTEYDQDYCIKTIKNYIKEYELDVPDDDWEDATEDYFEWVYFLRQNGEEYFGQDHYEWTYRAGITVKTRAYIWKYALIKAVEFLNIEVQ